MKSLLLILLAAASGLATWLYLNEMQAQTVQDAAEGSEVSLVQVLVFSKNVRRGTVVTEDVISWEERVEQTLPSDAITSAASNPDFPNSIVGKVSTANLFVGDLVRRSATTDGSTSFMTLALNPGMVAIAVPVSTTAIAGGYVLPEDQVDVIHTIVRSIEPGEEPYDFSKVILRNVRVLAVGEYATSKDVFQTNEQQDVSENVQQDTRVVGSTVTLELSEEQAKIMLSATQRGSLALALKAMDDYAPTEVGDVNMNGDATPAQVLSSANDDANNETYSISLIQAGVESIVTVQNSKTDREQADDE
jgi:pilus assembly protein CpaB